MLGLTLAGLIAINNVNLDAIEEQEELENRGKFLSGQLDDIKESRRKLDDLIQKINDDSHEKFVETFEIVRANFQELFRKLFGGGRADVLLTDPQDVLESGIEIVARPPGKELRSLSLLSGGEKTKLALAMLMVGRNNLLLLDEPTNNLDPPSREAVANALVDWPGAIILVSHDTEFVRELAPTKVLLMPDGDVDYFSESWLELVSMS